MWCSTAKQALPEGDNITALYTFKLYTLDAKLTAAPSPSAQHHYSSRMASAASAAQSPRWLRE